MIILILLATLALFYWLGGFHTDLLAWRDRQCRGRLKRRLRQRTEAIDDEFIRAKRAMNDAAGQSWRNLIEGGPRR